MSNLLSGRWSVSEPASEGSRISTWEADGMNQMAERVGFEPTLGYPKPVFKTGAINRSTTSPLENDWTRCGIAWPNL